MKETILVSGGGGKLAREIKKCAKNYNVIAPSKDEMDIRDILKIEIYLKKYNPKYFIHAAAFTKPMQNHEKFPEKSITTNIIGTSNIVIACLKFLETKLIYISTDYVYPGEKGNYKETDGISPYSKVNDGISKYGWSKLGGECSVHYLENFLIIRACLCDYPFPHEAALNDVKKSMIFTKDAAPKILKILDQRGIINLGGKSQSVYDFAKIQKPSISKISRCDIPNLDIAPDTSMDIARLNKLIN